MRGERRMRRAVFLDRDGVIIRTNVREGRPYAITSIDDLDVLAGAKDAIHRLRAAGFMTIVVTNQPDVVRGTVKREVAKAINDQLLETLAIDEIRVCYEVESPESNCYKPKPGMLLEAADKHDNDLPTSYMVGDRWRDVGAGKAAGCVTVFIDLDYSEQARDTPDHVVHSLAEAADLILSLESEGNP